MKQHVYSFQDMFKRARKYAGELWSWRIGCWWFEVWRRVVYYCSSRKPCPDCDHAARDHYISDPWNGERGCNIAWQCGGWESVEWDGCRCKWTGRGPMPRYCKCGEPEFEHDEEEGYITSHVFEEKKIA